MAANLHKRLERLQQAYAAQIRRRLRSRLAKLEQIEGRRAKAEEILRDLNWSPEQATGIVSCFDALPAWRGDVMRQWRGGNLCGWCARKQFDPLDVSAQMRFCSHDLRTTMMQMGAAINEAKTANEAADLFSGYAEKVSRISHE
jgi:hypothetical protein